MSKGAVAISEEENPSLVHAIDAAVVVVSVTRLGELLDFGQLFKAFGTNKFAQISHILRQFL